MRPTAQPRPRTSHHTLKPLAGRELDAHDLRYVTSVVRKTPAAAGIGYEDALSVGLIAYWMAAPRFDPGRGIPWTVYVEPYIQHAIQDEARGWDHLSRQHRREVKAGEVQAPRHVWLDDPLRPRGSLAAPARTDTLADITADPSRPDHDLRLTVDAALEIIHLADARVAAAMRLYYEQGWRDEDIAVLFGVGASRVSQLRDKGREMLRELLPLNLLDAA